MKRRFTEESWRKEPWFKGLVSAFQACKTGEQIEDFLRDVSTLSEMQALSERLEVARLLGRGLSYRQVAAMTGASTTTVTRVAHFIENGAGGYRHVLKVHRHHDMRKKMLEDGRTDKNAEEKIPEEPSMKTKSDNHKSKPSPLQKYLAK